MRSSSLSVVDTYKVFNKSVISDRDRDILITLYTPVIGHLAVTLYLTIWSDLDRLEVCSESFSHNHLVNSLKSSIKDILTARECLEAIGLVKSYVKYESVNTYIYELYSPLSVYEFLNHPILGSLLYNHVGETEFNLIKNKYIYKECCLEGYENVSKKLNQVYKTYSNIDNVDVKSKYTGSIEIDGVIDFELIVNMLNKGSVNDETFSCGKMKVINDLAYLYGYDTYRMSLLLKKVLKNGIVDTDELSRIIKKEYEFNNKCLPSLVYTTLPDELKSDVSSKSKKAKIISVFENTSPYDFLVSKNKGGKPTKRDLEIIENLMTNIGLNAGVVNVIVDYSLKKNNNKLVKNYVDAIGTQMKRSDVNTVNDAMNSIVKNISGIKKKTVNKKEPEWFNKKNDSVASEDDVNDMNDLLKGFK